nr:alginate export family protein [Rhizobium ruizarguesonis]
MSHTPRRKASCGRQDFAFALQRFVSSRDARNVRQSFNGGADCAC